MIMSYIPGRVRIRHKELQKKETMESLSALLYSQEGVTSILSNLRTGSILVKYDTSLVSEAMFEEAVIALKEALPVKEKKTLKRCVSLPTMSKEVEVQLLKVSYVALLLGLWGSKRLHYIAGSFFVVISLFHMARTGVLSSIKPKNM